MTHKRNTAGLTRAAKERRKNTIKRVELAIKQLLNEKKHINFNSISKAANVGKPWLYKETNIKEKIELLRRRKNSESIKITDIRNKASNKSKDNIIFMLKERVSKLETENKKLIEQIETLYGELYLKREEKS